MRILFPWCAALLLLAGFPRAHAQIPEERELWVPTDKLAEVLKQHPRAVLLSRAEYESLVRDGAQPLSCTPEGFPGAVISSAEYEGKVSGETLEVTGKLTVQVLSDDWVKVPLRFEHVALGAVEVSGKGGLTLTGPKEKLERTLLLRGRGERTVTVQFSTAIEWGGAGPRKVKIILPRGGGTAFHAKLPGQVKVEGNQPSRTEAAGDHTRLSAALPPKAGSLEFSWQPAGNALTPLPPIVENDTTFTIQADSLFSESILHVTAPVGAVPQQIEVSIPSGVTPVGVDGNDIQKWEATPERLIIHLWSMDPAKSSLGIRLRKPWPSPAAQGTVTLFVPSVVGVKSQRGTLKLFAHEGVLVREITAGAGLVARPAEVQPGEEHPTLAKWDYDGLPPGIQVHWQREQPHFTVDLDTLVDFRKDAIYLERTVAPHEKEGHVFQFAIAVPAGEEVLDVHAAQKPEPEWRVEGNRVLVHWTQAAGESTHTFTIQTRTEPVGWAAKTGAEKPQLFALTDARVEGAEQVAGYIALRAAEDFRLEAEASETLERRDGRITPVKGAYAWFRRDDYGLRVKVTRREGERLATLTGYALPLAGGLDVHAQIAWDFRYAGARSVEVKVPKEVAERFNFEGAQIASRTLAGDTWTIAFQKEITGPYVLSVEGQFPITHEEKEGETRHFTAQVPVIKPLHAQRVSGSWAVEANTDTEVEVAAPGMNSLDALLAPAVGGYQPRHRVIGVYAWLGADYKLSLTGTRHAGAAVLSEVVDSLELQSVAALTGAVRTQATLHLRTTGQQFLDVTLPAQSGLLSLLVEGSPVKPVEGKPGDVRVSLPEKSDSTEAITIVLLFETAAGAEWKKDGRGLLPVPTLPADVPVLRTEWQAWFPEGFDLSHWSSNLQSITTPQPRPLVLAPLSIAALFRQRIPGARTVARPDFGELQSQPGVISTFSTPAPEDFALKAEWDRAVRKGPTLSPAQLTPGEPNRLRQKLESLIIPKLELHEATIQESIDFLASKSRSLDTAEPDPARRGVKFRFKNVESSDARITVSLNNIPLGEALRYVTSLANLKFNTTPDDVEIVPQGTVCDTLVTQDWKVGGNEMRRGLQAGARQYLLSTGVVFPPGSSVFYVPASSRLIMRNTQENLDLTAAIVESGMQPEEPIPAPGALGPRQPSELQKKLQSIILPEVELHGATIREAIDYLERKAIASDTAEPVPSKKGVNIVLRLDSASGGAPYIPPLSPPPRAPLIPGLDPLPGANPPPTPEPGGDVATGGRIDVSLRNIPLLEAIRYITSLFNLKFKVELDVVSILPQGTPTDTLITKEWKVPPGFLSNAPTAGAADQVTGSLRGDGGKRIEARDYLMAAGAKFPPGSSAVFLPGRSVLIVKGIQEDLDLIDGIVEYDVDSSTPSATPSRVSGLLPMRIDLPMDGTAVKLAGLGAPTAVTFRYAEAGSRARSLWLLFLTGAAAFLLLGRRRPWWRAAWLTLALSAIPLCLAPESTGVCNALLGGWLFALVIERVAYRFVFHSRPMELAP